MSAPKTITISVPPGLPDGWECVGYAIPKDDEMVFCTDGKWHKGPFVIDHAILVARRVQTAADWANAQPRLRALAAMLPPPAQLYIMGPWRYQVIDEDGNSALLYAEECPPRFRHARLRPLDGKWAGK